MKKLNLALMTAIASLLIALPFVAAAMNFGNPSSDDINTFNSILAPVMKIYNLVKYTATGIAALVLLLAGVSYMVSGSDPKKRDNAKSMAMYVVIGLVIIWAAPLVVNFIVG